MCAPTCTSNALGVRMLAAACAPRRARPESDAWLPHANIAVVLDANFLQAFHITGGARGLVKAGAPATTNSGTPPERCPGPQRQAGSSKPSGSWGYFSRKSCRTRAMRWRPCFTSCLPFQKEVPTPLSVKTLYSAWCSHGPARSPRATAFSHQTWEFFHQSS